MFHFVCSVHARFFCKTGDGKLENFDFFQLRCFQWFNSAQLASHPFLYLITSLRIFFGLPVCPQETSCAGINVGYLGLF